MKLTNISASSMLALALAAMSVHPAAARSSVPIKNIVLVHGAWADGSGWKGVYDILRRDGFHVSVVANPDSGVADDVAATERVLARQDGPVILVGHSYGGVVITEAGNDPKVAGLVYIAAFAPDAGETAGQFLTSGPPPVTSTPDGFLFLNRDAYLAAFAPDVPMEMREFMADEQAPIAASAITTVAKTPAWRSKPSWYLVSRDDQVIPPEAERMFARRMKATTQEVSGSHVAFVSHPDVAARLIEQAAVGAAAP